MTTAAQGTIKMTGVENLSKKIRNFAKNSPQVAAQAVKKAADDTLLLAFQAAMNNRDKKYGNYPHNWKKRLYNSLNSRVIQNPNYPSVVVGFDLNISHAQTFLDGGHHGDWPLDRMTEWIQDKDKIKNSANARRRAERIIKLLESKGQVSYQEVIVDPILKGLKGNEIVPGVAEFRVQYREELKRVMNLEIAQSMTFGDTPF